MKIYALNQTQQKFHVSKYNTQLTQNVFALKHDDTPAKSPVSNTDVSFKTLPKIALSLQSKYDARTSSIANRYIEQFKQSPKLNILEFLKPQGIKEKLSGLLVKNSSVIFKTLSGITEDEDLSKKFIEEINANPRQSNDITKLLIDKIGGPDKFQQWYYGINGYQRAYERWFKKEIFENDNVSVNDMVKISPNIMIEAMLQKSLRTEHTLDFVIGNVPEDIGTIEDFRQITSMVRNSVLVKEFLKFKDFMDDTDAFMAKYPEAKEIAINPARVAKDFIKKKIIDYRNPATTSEERKKLEEEIPFLKYMNKTTIEINGKKFTYNPILRPYSTKILFALMPENVESKSDLVLQPGTDNALSEIDLSAIKLKKSANANTTNDRYKYFITMEMLNSEKNTVDKENSCIRPDSPYLNAMVDYYLKANGCENVPDVKFYDYKSNAVVYPFITGTSPKQSLRSDKNGVINEYSALNNEMKPLTELGIYITDCFYENFMLDETTGKTMIVDNGHAKFANALRPGVKMIHMGLPDFYGRDFISLQAAMFQAINK